MKKFMILFTALVLCLSAAACNRVSQKEVDEMIEEAVEEALEEYQEEMDEDGDEDHDREDDDEDEDRDRDNDNDDDDHEKDKDHDDDNEHDEDDDVSITTGDATFDYVGEDIPDGFPTDAVPLYEKSGAEITGALKTTLGDAVSYSLGIGTDEETPDVIDKVSEALYDIYNKDSVYEMSSDNYAMFVVEADEWSFTITIGEGDAEGFETYILYSVVSN